MAELGEGIQVRVPILRVYDLCDATTFQTIKLINDECVCSYGGKVPWAGLRYAMHHSICYIRDRFLPDETRLFAGHSHTFGSLPTPRSGARFAGLIDSDSRGVSHHEQGYWEAMQIDPSVPGFTAMNIALLMLQGLHVREPLICSTIFA